MFTIKQESLNWWRATINGARVDVRREWSRFHSFNWYEARTPAGHVRADTYREMVAKLEAIAAQTA